MQTFNRGKYKNPVHETKLIETDTGSITFKLRPMDSNIEYLARAVRRSSMDDFDLALGRLGTSRISGWEGLVDELGNEIPFNASNFGDWIDTVESVEYATKIGEYTMNQRYPSVEKPSGECEQVKEQSVETLDSNSTTTSES